MFSVQPTVLEVVSCPASSSVTSSSRIRRSPTRVSFSLAVEAISRVSTSSPEADGFALRSAPSSPTIRSRSVRACRNSRCPFSGSQRGTRPSVSISNIAWSCTASKEWPIDSNAPRSASSRVLPSTPRVSAVTSDSTSTGRPAPSYAASRSTRPSASSTITPACAAIRLCWNTGWMVRRCSFHSAPSDVSSPSPSARLASE